MKITSLEPLTCDSGIAGRGWLFLKVTTDEGIVGWGEGYDWQAAPALAEAIRLVGQEVVGQDPRRVDFISRRLGDRGGAGAPERMKVIAALDLALYDIKGKWLGVPAYELIGGLYRDRIPLYWSSRAGRTPERAGVRALKTNLLIPGLEGAIDRRLINAAVEFVGALRERCGPGIAILVDVGRDYLMGGLVQLARALEPFDLYWLEVDDFDPDALLAARQQTRTRICHGGALVGRQAFRPFLERHATNVVTLETLANGLSESRRIADLAAHYDAMFSPHNAMSPLSTLINAHLCAVMPNCEILEMTVDDVPWTGQLLDHPPRIEGGELIVPDGPGWGADVVEAEVARHPLRGPA